jgi:hypothetical protein
MTFPGSGRYPVAQGAEGPRETVPGDVPREPHVLMTCSRTKWSRMIPGAWPGSQWQRIASRILSRRSAWGNDFRAEA